MIKCEATVCGTISRSAAMRSNREGQPFMSFSMNVGVQEKGERQNVELRVTRDGQFEPFLSDFAAGTRVKVTGELVFYKKNDVLVFSLHATQVDLQADDEDYIEGKIDFRGAIGKSIDEKNDRKGNPYIVFSAFSTEKRGEDFSFTWIKFIQFNKAREEWMQPGVGINAQGGLEVSVFNGKPYVSCHLENLSFWDRHSNRYNR